jgi:hypothetical protein
MLGLTKDEQDVKFRGMYQIKYHCGQLYVRKSRRNIEVRYSEYTKNGWMNLRSWWWQNIASR